MAHRRIRPLKKHLVLILSLLVTSCGIAMFKKYGEWIHPDAAGLDAGSTASLDWSTQAGVIFSIDGDDFGKGYEKARLAAGGHYFEYSAYTGEFGTDLHGKAQIELVAGHEYEFRMKLCFWCMPRKYAVWVDDRTTGQLVWGKRPDWPSWYL